MATDQGKTSNLWRHRRVMADLTGQSMEATGTTMFRPPYTPVAIGALAGRAAGDAIPPDTPDPDPCLGQAEQGAAFIEVGPMAARAIFPATRTKPIGAKPSTAR